MSQERSPHLRRNFTLGVVNGVIFMAGSSLLGPTTILPKFLENLFDSKALIGLGSYILMLGWSLPQVAAAYFARSLTYRKPLYVFANMARMALIGSFVIAFHVFRSSPATVGTLFFALLGTAGIAAGTTGLAYQDIIARTIPATKRGSYNAYRILGGQGVGALASGFFAKYVLSHPEKFPYPTNYLVIFGAAWALMSMGVVVFSRVVEPPDESVQPRRSLLGFGTELVVMVKGNENYRRFLLQRVLRSCESLAAPYYVLFATDKLGLGEDSVGTFQVVTVATMLLAALWWGRISDRKGNRRVLTLSSAAAAAVPAAALCVWGLAGTGVLEGATALSAAMSCVFVLAAVASAGSQIGFQNYVMDTAPAAHRTTYLGLTTTIDGVLLVAIPAAGGALIDATDYWVGFVLAGVVTSASVAVARRLWEPRSSAGGQPTFY